MKIFKDSIPEYNVIGKDEIEGAVEVLKTGQLSGFVAMPGEPHLGGKYVQKLEKLFCDKFGSLYAASFNSATSALHGALIAADIREGDEVLVPTWSMSASATSVVMTGAKPVFVDIEKDFFCMDTDKILGSLTKKTKAIIVVNLFGLPSDLLKIRKICDENNLVLIEDNAQAPGAKCKNKYTGSYGDISIYSLNRHKTIQCGEGGIALTNNKKYIHRLRLVRNHAEAVFPEFHKDDKILGGDDIIGYNYRLTSLQAAIAIPQMDKLDYLNKYRVSLANKLSSKLLDFNFLEVPKIRNDCTHVYYLYPIIFDEEKAGMTRDEFVTRMSNEGAPVSAYARPIYRMPLFSKHSKNLKPKNFPITEFLWKKLIVTSICRPPLNEKHINLFIKAIKKILN